MLYFSWENHVGHMNRKIIWAMILFCVVCVLQLILNVLVISPHEDLGEDRGRGPMLIPP